MNPKRNILVVSHSGGKAGAEKSFARMVSVLSRMNYNVYGVIPHQGWLSQILGDKKISIFFMKVPWVVTDDRNGIRASLRFLRSFYYAAHLLLLIKKHRISLVVTNSSVMISPAIAAKIAGVPHVMFLREFYLKNEHLYCFFGMNFYLRLLTMLSDKLICVSEAVRNMLAFTPDNKAVVIHNYEQSSCPTVTDEVKNRLRMELQLVADDFVVIMASKIYALKRQEDAIFALSMLQKDTNKVKLLLVGGRDPSYSDYLKELAERLRVSRYVVYAGYHRDIRPFYAISDMALSCSDADAFPYIVLEAFRFGIPVLAAASGGHLDTIIDGETGFLFNARAPDKIAEKILFLYRHKEIRLEISRNAKKHLETRFSSEKYAAKLNNVLSTLQQLIM